MKYFLMLVLLSTLFIVGCDDRGNNDPTMDITIESDYNNMVYNKTGFNEMTFLFQLDGPSSKIVNQRINVNMATSVGNFIGTGSSQSMITNEFGYAEGRFVAGTGYGSTSIEFVLETWPDEKKIYPITIIDFPKIDSLAAGSYSLLPDGISSTSIQAYLSSANADLELVKIIFEATDGRITQTEVFGDAGNIASTNLIAPSHDAFIRVTAKLDLLPTTYKSINIRCENP
jgi:hypothetical protein